MKTYLNVLLLYVVNERNGHDEHMDITNGKITAKFYANVGNWLYRISMQRPHYITSSYTYQFFEKNYICSSLQYRSALVVGRMRNIFN